MRTTLQRRSTARIQQPFVNINCLRTARPTKNYQEVPRTTKNYQELQEIKELQDHNNYYDINNIVNYKSCSKNYRNYEELQELPRTTKNLQEIPRITNNYNNYQELRITYHMRRTTNTY